MHPDRRRDRNEDPVGRRYLEWVTGLGCLICCLEEWRRFFRGEMELPPRTRFGSEAAHIGGKFSAKAPNRYAAPLCTLHHRAGKCSQEVLKMDFFDRFKLDWSTIRARLWIAFLCQDIADETGVCKVVAAR